MLHPLMSSYCRSSRQLTSLVLLLLAAAAVAASSNNSKQWMSSSEAFVMPLPSVVESALQKRKMVAVVHSPMFIGTSPRLSPVAAAAPLFAAGSSNNNIDNINDQSTTAISSSNKRKLTHADIEWKLRPDNNINDNSDNNDGTSPKQLFTRLKIKSSATLLRIYSKITGKKLPPVLCPKGGRAVLEAYYRDDHHDPTPSTAKQEEVVGKKNVLRKLFRRRNKKQMIAKFGFTTSRGPSNTEIDTTIRTIYNINPPPNVATIAAIIYMYVEPQYRQCNVGSLALQVISAIQSVQAVDFTILVASGDDTLVEWYERRGYSRAPLLQDMMGSPNGEYGVAMIAPVHVRDGFFDECRVKWW